MEAVGEIFTIRTFLRARRWFLLTIPGSILVLLAAFVPPASTETILVAVPVMLTIEGFLVALSGSIKNHKQRTAALGIGFVTVLVSLATILHTNFIEFAADMIAFLSLLMFYSWALLEE